MNNNKKRKRVAANGTKEGHLTSVTGWQKEKPKINTWKKNGETHKDKKMPKPKYQKPKPKIGEKSFT